MQLKTLATQLVTLSFATLTFAATAGDLPPLEKKDTYKVASPKWKVTILGESLKPSLSEIPLNNVTGT